MSLQQHFMAQVASFPGLHVPGMPGGAVASTGAYEQILSMGMRRRIEIANLAGGRGGEVAGVKFDGSGSREQYLRAEALVRAHEWAQYFATRTDGHRDARKHMRDGAAFSQGYLNSCYRSDAKASDAGRGRLDAVAPMASQGLTYISPTVYEYQHNNLPCWDEQFVKIWTGADPASNEVVWYEMDNVGVAKASSSYDLSTIQMVNGPLASDNKILIVPALVGMETNFMDARRASMADRMGKPDFMIEVMKRKACDRTIAEFFDNLWFGGDATLGIDGLMNNPFVTTLNITGGAWSAKTALQRFDDLMTMAWAIYNRTAGALADFGKIRIILPPTQFRLLSSPITAAGSETILAFFMNYWKATYGETVGTPKIELQARLAAANSYAYNGGSNILAEDTALILYQTGDADEDPTFTLTQPIEVPAPVRTTGVGDVTYYHARGGGIKIPDARRIEYVVGI